MAGFMDACSQASQIIVPFLDTIVTGSIRNKETVQKECICCSYLQIYTRSLQRIAFIV